jgi:hypothetical protein
MTQPKLNPAADLLDATDAAIESIPDTDWHEAQVRNLQ